MRVVIVGASGTIGQAVKVGFYYPSRLHGQKKVHVELLRLTF